MQFESKYAGYIYIARPEIASYEMGYKIVKAKELDADFGGIFGAEFHDGDSQPRALIRGGFFDSEEAQRNNGWSDEERELVETRMLDEIKNPRFTDFRLHERPKPQLPWPTYDNTPDERIPVLAQELQLVDQAIAYESKTANREFVIRRLEELRDEAKAAESLTAA